MPQPWPLDRRLNYARPLLVQSVHCNVRDSFWRYTCAVRVSVASVLAFLLLTIACADPLCCADGCDRGGMELAHSAPSGADCPTCLSALVAHRHPPITRTDAAIDALEPTTSPLIAPFRTDVDHPPRLA